LREKVSGEGPTEEGSSRRCHWVALLTQLGPQSMTCQPLPSIANHVWRFTQAREVR